MSSEQKENHFRILLLLLEGAALVERKIFDSKVIGTLAAFLSTHKTILKDLHKKKTINASQWTLLNSGNPSSTDFDISLLTCLLRNVCGLATPLDNVWTNPGVNDFSTEADIARLKGHRNKISHQPGVGISQADFQNEWRDICQVLDRLNLGLKTDGITDLQTQLDGYKTGSIDISTANQYENKIRECKELELAQQNIILEEITAMKEQIQNNLEDIKKSMFEQKQTTVQQHEHTREVIKESTATITKKLEDLKLHPEPIDSSKYYFGDADEAIFLKTSSYKMAEKKLGESGIVVLSGHPGEGKTTMAKMLLLESSHSEKILIASDPSECRHIPKRYTSILIDDIFGPSTLNDQLLWQWDRRLPDLNTLVRNKDISYIVITTRHYILKEARQRLSHRIKEMFSDKHIVILSSEDLSRDERLGILNKHLNANGRDINDTEKARICSAEGSDDDKQMIGFPACTEMFATNGDLFIKGSEFFKYPFEFFRDCLESISINVDKFMGLILVWVSESHVFAASGLEPENISKLVNVADDFSYTKLRDNVKVLHEQLKQLETCFLTYDENEETYAFRYHIIADAVGIVAAFKYKNAVIKYGNIDFIMSHVTCTASGDSSKDIKLKKPNYKVLINKIDTLLFVEGQLNTHVDIKHHSQLPGLSDMVVATSNISILQNEAFGSIDFVTEYLNPQTPDIRNNCLSQPVLFASNHFKPEYKISFQKGKMPLCMPSALLALGKDIMIAKCLERNLLTKDEKDVSLMLAVMHKRVDLVNDLLRAGTGITDDSLKIAANDSVDREIYKLLLGQITIGIASLPEVIVRSPDVNPKYAKPDDLHTWETRGALSYNYEAVLYILACSWLLRRRPNVLPTEGFNLQIAQSVYWSGWNEVKQKVIEYKPPKDFGMITQDVLINVIASKKNTTLVHILHAKSPFDQYCRLMKFKIAKQGLFHKAVIESDGLLLKTAIELGLNPNKRDVYGRTPICLAASYDKHQFVSLMSSIPNIDLELADRNGFTPLHAAVWNNNDRSVTILVHRANVNCRDNRGNTPLHLACKNGNTNIINTLLHNRNIDVRVVNKRGDTVYESLRSYCALKNRPKKRI